ncbi:MAG: hypothetical protein ACXU86_14425 [Archangium sp.]
MTTLTNPPLRLPLAPRLPLRTWFGALRLLSGLLMLTGLGGLATLLSGKALAAPPGPLLALAGLLCGGLALTHWRLWQVTKLERRGWELLLAGRPEAAIRALEVAASGGSEVQRARSHYGLTLAWLRQGDFERALAQGQRTTRTWGRRSAPLREAQAPALMATLLALYGELDDARDWVGRIQRPLSDKTDYALLAQVVVLCREGRDVDAVRRIQRTAREHVPEMDVGAVAVLHAFARSRLGGQLVPLKPGCVLPEKPARASGYEYLACRWPELAAFLRGAEAPALASGA